MEVLISSYSASNLDVADLEYDLLPKFSRGNSWIAPTLNFRDYLKNEN